MTQYVDTDKFQRFITTFYDRYPGLIPNLKKAAEDSGLSLELTLAEKKRKIQMYHQRQICWADVRINNLKDNTFPELEKRIKELYLRKEDAIETFGHTEFTEYQCWKKENGEKIKKVDKNSRIIHSWRFSYRELMADKMFLLVEDWDSLPKNMKRDFVKMQISIYKFDRIRYRKLLKEARKQIQYSKRILQKLDRLSEEETNIYYTEVVKAESNGKN